MNFLDNLQVFFLAFVIFCVRRFIHVLDPENPPGSGSGKIRTGSGSRAHKRTSDNKSMKKKKKACKTI